MENSNLPITLLKPFMPSRPLDQAGFWFRPTRQELILYLHKKLAKLPYPKNIIHDCDNIYGDKEGMHEPWNLLDTSENTREYFYIFTRLKKISSNCDSSKKIMRRAGSGTWHANACTDVKDYKGKLIGVNKYYKFELKEGHPRKNHGKWTMHEFFLPHKQSPGDVVLCVIGYNGTISITDDPESSIIFDKEICNTTMQSNRFRLSKSKRIMHDENQQISRKRMFKQRTEFGPSMAVVQQRLLTYGVEDQQNSRKRAQSSGVGFPSVSSQFGLSDQQQVHSGEIMEVTQEPLTAVYPTEKFREQQAMPHSSYDLLHTMQQPYFSSFEDAYNSTTANCFQNLNFLQISHEFDMLKNFQNFLEQQAIPPQLVTGSLDDSKPQPPQPFSLSTNKGIQYPTCQHMPESIGVTDQPQVDPVAEEGHRQFNEVMEDIEKTAASRGIPVEDYLDEILKNI